MFCFFYIKAIQNMLIERTKIVSQVKKKCVNTTLFFGFVTPCGQKQNFLLLTKQHLSFGGFTETQTAINNRNLSAAQQLESERKAQMVLICCFTHFDTSATG